MPVNIEPHGRRSVQAEVEVPGTPEEVWRAIATGPGISSWFVPATVEERAGGAVVCDFGPGMESHSTITEWQPPHRYVAESRDDMGPDDPTVATEWSVEAKDGGHCVVRVVHSWFTDSDAWDEQFEGHTYGWLSFFRLLHVYLEQFSGQPVTPFQVVGVSSESKEAVWAALTGPLGLRGAEVGDRVETPAGAPPLAGVVEYAGHPMWPEDLLIRLEAPAPGMAHFVPHPMGTIVLTLRFYLFGDGAAAAAAQAEPIWRAWVEEHFALPAAASAAD